MPERDPFDILKNHDPATEPQLDLAPDEMLLANITSTTSTTKRSTRVRRRILIAAAIILTLVSLAAAWYVASRPVSTLAVTCYAHTSLDSDRHGTASLTGSPSTQDCEHAWKIELLTNPAVQPGSVPPLTACVTGQGGLAVFPTDEPTMCQRLGLAQREPDRPSDRLGTVALMQQQVTEFIQQKRCHSLDTTESTVRRILDANGLNNWTVLRQPEHPDRPCGTVAYDIPGRTVLIVPHILLP